MICQAIPKIIYKLAYNNNDTMAESNYIPRLLRLSSILTLLQSRSIITASEIAEKFDISKRTAYRDIKALEATGVPIYTEEGKGYSIMEGYTLPPIMFSEQEANALITAEKLILRNKDQSLIDNHSSAIAKIKAVLRYTKKSKAETLSERIMYFQNYGDEITSNNLSNIQSAITNLELLKIKYRSISKDELTERTIEPQAIYHAKENWILIAWCHLRDGYREFRLDKIQSLSHLNQHFESRNFDLQKYFNDILRNYSSPLP